MKYRKKPVVIEAMQVPEPHKAEGFALLEWLDKGECKYKVNLNGTISIETLEGTMKAKTGDWIIKGVRDEYYPCRNGIFKETYEACGYE